MKILGLDLSLSNTGWAIYDGKTIKYGSIPVQSSLSEYARGQFVVEEIEKIIGKDIVAIDEMVAEDTYFGVNYGTFKMLARLGGIFLEYWAIKKGKEMKFLLAIVARKLFGVDPRSTKAEIQLIIAKKLKLIKDTDILIYKNKITEIKTEKQNGNITKSKADYALEKISKEIAKETKLDCDQADAILLSMAYYISLNRKPKVENNEKRISKKRRSVRKSKKILPERNQEVS